MLKDVHRTFNSKISILKTCLDKYDLKETPRESLNKIVKTGNCSPAL